MVRAGWVPPAPAAASGAGRRFERSAPTPPAHADNERTAIGMVNAEERNPSACAVETVAFVRGVSVATARSKAETFAVVEILVVGVDLGSGFQSITPGAYFMLVKIDERNA